MANLASWYRAILAQLKKGFKVAKKIRMPAKTKAFMKKALHQGYIPLTAKQKRFFKQVMSGRAGLPALKKREKIAPDFGKGIKASRKIYGMEYPF